MSDRRIGLVTDSSSQIPADIVERYAVEVVPMTVTVDGVDHLEGVDLDADGFYERFADGATPEISTSQPSPGRFVEAYERLTAAGCDEIVSLHLSSSMSGTVASARLAARSIDLPVTVIDTASASYGVAVCVWASGVAIDRGANIDDIERRIEQLVPRIATAFMVGVPLLSERSGRAETVDFGERGASGDDAIPLLGMTRGELEVIERVTTIDDTIDVMSTYAAARGPGVTVALGTADAPSRPLTERLEAALAGLDTIDEIVHYRIGPSVGAHTGPGTFGLFVFPTIR